MILWIQTVLRHLQVRLIYRQRKGSQHLLDSRMGQHRNGKNDIQTEHLLLPRIEVNALGIRN